MVQLVRFELYVENLLPFPSFGNSLHNINVVMIFGETHGPTLDCQLPVRDLRGDMVKISGARYFRSDSQKHPGD